MSNDTKSKSKTSATPLGSCGSTQGTDAQNLINEKLKSFSYGSTSDLSCIALNQVEMDLVYESINAAIAMTRLMDRESSEWAIPRLLELKRRFERAP